MRVTYKPLDEVVIHSSVEMSLKALVRVASQGYEMGSVGKTIVWADGIAFDYVPMAGTEITHKELIEHNREHWEYLLWAKMPKCESVIDFGEGVKIPVFDVTNDQKLSEVAKWLKKERPDE